MSLFPPKPGRVYGHRATPSRIRIDDDDGVIHIVCEGGEIVACGRRVSATPWEREPAKVNGTFCDKNTLATCVRCIAMELPPLVKPETYR